ncbi:unnamed protein product, partial [Staurois parvus]
RWSLERRSRAAPAKIERVKRRRAAGEGRHLTGKRVPWEREGASEPRLEQGSTILQQGSASVNGVSGRNSATSLVSLILMMGHYSSH